MGRPKLPAGEFKKNYPFRLSGNELIKYKEAAKKDGVSLTEWIRKVLTEAASSVNCTTES